VSSVIEINLLLGIAWYLLSDGGMHTGYELPSSPAGEARLPLDVLPRPLEVPSLSEVVMAGTVLVGQVFAQCPLTSQMWHRPRRQGPS
jgi:hypothetical protein